MSHYIFSLLGLIALFIGARMLINGATKLAGWAWVSSVVGLTVVAYGTSTPELIVSVSSIWGGHDGMAMVNVIGSNIFNILFFLGSSALLGIPIFISDHRITRGEGMAFIVLFGIYLFGKTV